MAYSSVYILGILFRCSPFQDTYSTTDCSLFDPSDILLLLSSFLFPFPPSSVPLPLSLALLVSCLGPDGNATRSPLFPVCLLMLTTTITKKQHRALHHGRAGSVSRGGAQIGARARRLQLAIRLLRTRPGTHAHAPHRPWGYPPTVFGGARAQLYPVVDPHHDGRAIRAARSGAHEGACGAGQASRSAGSSGALQPQEAELERLFGRGGGGGGNTCHLCREGFGILLRCRGGGSAGRTPVRVRRLSARQLFAR